jgi:hypothetical protein
MELAAQPDPRRGGCGPPAGAVFLLGPCQNGQPLPWPGSSDAGDYLSGGASATGGLEVASSCFRVNGVSG